MMGVDYEERLAAELEDFVANAPDDREMLTSELLAWMTDAQELMTKAATQLHACEVASSIGQSDELGRLLAEATPGPWEVNSTVINFCGSAQRLYGSSPDARLIVALYRAAASLRAHDAERTGYEGHDEPCYYCGKPCSALAGNPGMWPIALCHEDAPGVARWHHNECVSSRLRVSEAERAETKAIIQRGMKANADAAADYDRRSRELCTQRDEALAKLATARAEAKKGKARR